MPGFARDLPAAVEALVLRALAKDPAARYQSAAEMAEEVRRARPGLIRRQPRVKAQTGLLTTGTEPSWRQLSH
jgi:hypothetical protein